MSKIEEDVFVYYVTSKDQLIDPKDNYKENEKWVILQE